MRCISDGPYYVAGLLCTQRRRRESPRWLLLGAAHGCGSIPGANASPFDRPQRDNSLLRVEAHGQQLAFDLPHGFVGCEGYGGELRWWSIFSGSCRTSSASKLGAQINRPAARRP